MRPLARFTRRFESLRRSLKGLPRKGELQHKGRTAFRAVSRQKAAAMCTDNPPNRCETIAASVRQSRPAVGDLQFELIGKRIGGHHQITTVSHSIKRSLDEA